MSINIDQWVKEFQQKTTIFYLGSTFSMSKEALFITVAEPIYGFNIEIPFVEDVDAFIKIAKNRYLEHLKQRRALYSLQASAVQTCIDSLEKDLEVR